MYSIVKAELMPNIANRTNMGIKDSNSADYAIRSKKEASEHIPKVVDIEHAAPNLTTIIPEM